MNPEEGELRPQILDRFGIYAETENMEDLGMRHLILERNEGFIADPSAFISKYMGETEGFRSRIEAARTILREVDAPLEALSMVADTCSRLRVDGFRPDIVSVRAAKALAAFHGRRAVASEEVSLSVQLALGHRTRRSGMDSPPSHREIRKALRRAKSRALRLSFGLKMPNVRGIIQLPKELFDRLMRNAFRSTLLGLVMFGVLVLTITYTLETLRSALSPRPPNALTLLLEAAGGGLLYMLINGLMPRKRRGEVAVGLIDMDKMNIEAEGRLSNPDTPMGERMGGFAPAKVRYGKGDDGAPEYGSKILRYLEGLQRRPKAEGPRRLARPVRGGGYGGGRRTKATSSSRGRYAWYQVPKGRPRDVALVPTLRAAALNQSGRVGRGPRVVIRPEDVREKVREYRAPFSIVLLVDMSLSMTESVENVVQTIYDLHRDVYRRRDRVGLIVFKGSKAYTLQHPTKNLDLVVDKLRKAGASDYTPLAAGLLQAWKALKQEKLRNRDAVPHLVVVSDGIVNVPLDEPRSPLTRRRYTSEAQADSLDMARLISKEGYRVQVVNTNHLASEAEAPQVVEGGMRVKLTPTQFLMELARLSGGKYVGLSMKKPVL